MAFLSLIIFAFFLFLGEAEARLQTCVLDGGGTPEQRFCGLKAFTQQMHSMYAEYSETRTGTRELSNDFIHENILTGDGESRGGDCHVPIEKSCPGLSGPCTPASAPPERRMFTTQVSSANRSSHIYPANATEVTNQCLTGASSADVCHFYSLNHGTLAQPGDIPEGATDYSAMDTRISLYVPPGSPASYQRDLSATQLRTVMNNSQCGTKRFILNNCHSGGMMKMLFDDQGNLIPNRCGTSAAAYYQEARGSASAPKPVTLRNGTQFRVRVNEYDYSRSMFTSLQLGARRLRLAPERYSPYSASLDEAHYYSQVADQTTETPQMSSDFYFDKYFGAQNTDPIGAREITDQVRMHQETAEHFKCFGNDVLGQTYSVVDRLDRQVSGVYNSLPGARAVTMQMASSGYSDQEMTDINNDLALSQDHIDLYTSHMCSQFFRPADAESGMGRDCPTGTSEMRAYIREYYQKFRKRRQAALKEYKACVKKSGYSVSCTFETAKVKKVLADDRYTRRYEVMVNKLGRTLAFYQKAPKAKIQEYLSLRRCETGAYDQPVPDAIQVLK